MADFKNVLMDIGTVVLPSVTGALKEFDSALKALKGWLPESNAGGPGDASKWGVGTTALEGALVGAAVGSVFPGVGTTAGAGLGALTGAAAAAVHDSAAEAYMKAQADKQDDVVNQLRRSGTGACHSGATAGAADHAQPQH